MWPPSWIICSSCAGKLTRSGDAVEQLRTMLDPQLPSSLTANLAISAGSSIPNRPTAMIFSATSCVIGSLRSFKPSACKACL
jgi:hypothetical protein